MANESRKLKLTRQQMLEGLKVDAISNVVQLVNQGLIEDLEAWLWPIIQEQIEDEYWDDEDLANFYEERLDKSAFEED